MPRCLPSLTPRHEGCPSTSTLAPGARSSCPCSRDRSPARTGLSVSCRVLHGPGTWRTVSRGHSMSRWTAHEPGRCYGGCEHLQLSPASTLTHLCGLRCSHVQVCSGRRLATAVQSRCFGRAYVPAVGPFIAPLSLTLQNPVYTSRLRSSSVLVPRGCLGLPERRVVVDASAVTNNDE